MRKNIDIRSASKGSAHHFFGFHDVCPWNTKGEMLLAHETNLINDPPRGVSISGKWEADAAGICVIDAKSGELRRIAETRAWNFQLGARLQWIPGTQNQAIYNDRRKDGKSISVIADAATGKKIKELEHLVYAVSPGGDFALSIDFGELVGGYSYTVLNIGGGPELQGVDDPFRREKDTGIFKINLETGEQKTIVFTYDVATKDHSPTPEEHHVLTHVAFNPSGTRICFIDKYRLPDGGFMQRLVTANPDGSATHVFPGHVTHFCWRNDEEIFAYGKLSPRLMSLRNRGVFQNPILKPLLNIARKMRGSFKQKIAGQGYLLFKDGAQSVERVAVGAMTEDGHPSFSPDGKWLITDTYPDKNHERTLILYDWENKERIDLGKFKSLPPGVSDSWDVSQMRCDLHPRWNRAGTKICIDSVHEGTRQMYVINLEKVVN